ncbi:MAG: universal stress protein [Verrucomicrobiales bacterium]|nr:universal stress protein [Verrucomicrobiales bacterium]
MSMNPIGKPTILCGTDFSIQAAEATQVAAALAKRIGSRLFLVHAIDDSGLSSSYPDILQTLSQRGRERLDQERVRLQPTGCELVDEIVVGSAARALTTLAEREQASLVVVSSLGQIAPSRLLVGSVAERTAETAAVPTLVVRRSADLLNWAGGQTTLRVMVAIDFSESSLTALQWVKELSELAKCTVIAAHVNWPPEEAERLGLSGSMSLTENPPLVRQVLERDLGERVSEVFGDLPVTLRVIPGWGRTDHHLLELAHDEKIDLLVVGSHQRQGLSRLRLGSVSRGILHHAPMNVAIVPTRPRSSTGRSIPKLDRVLVSTDLSELGNRAVAYAYSLLERGGTVQIVHAMPPSPGKDPESQLCDAATKDIAATIRTLIPEASAGRGILTEIELVASSEPALAIHQAAERFGADVICLSSHGKSGLSQALFGSVAQAVMKQTRRPVMVVRGTAE